MMAKVTQILQCNENIEWWDLEIRKIFSEICLDIEDPGIVNSPAMYFVSRLSHDVKLIMNPEDLDFLEYLEVFA